MKITLKHTPNEVLLTLSFLSSESNRYFNQKQQNIELWKIYMKAGLRLPIRAKTMRVSMEAHLADCLTQWLKQSPDPYYMAKGNLLYEEVRKQKELAVY